MKKVLLGLLMAMSVSFAASQTTVMQQDMFANMGPDDKAVVVAVHYGSTDADVRKDAIEKFNARLRKEFPDCDFRQAWTSRSIVRQLDAQGEVILTPVQLLNELSVLGYTHVLIQSSEMTDGVELQHLRNEVQAAKRKFKQVRLGAPLLHNVKDYEMMILATAAAYGEEKMGNVLVCYASKGSLDTSYTMLDYMLRDKGMDNWYVTTIGGYPDLENLKCELKQRKDKKINLIPCVFLAGEHIKADVVKKMKDELEDAKFKVKVTMHSLGESDEILDRYMEHAKFARQYRALTPSEIKIVESTY